MRRLRRPLRSLLGSVLALALAGAAGAAAEPAATTAPTRWHGRYCTPLGCSGAASSPVSGAAGFAAAIVASGWIARRRRIAAH